MKLAVDELLKIRAAGHAHALMTATSPVIQV